MSQSLHWSPISSQHRNRNVPLLQYIITISRKQTPDQDRIKPYNHRYRDQLSPKWFDGVISEKLNVTSCIRSPCISKSSNPCSIYVAVLGHIQTSSLIWKCIFVTPSLCESNLCMCVHARVCVCAHVDRISGLCCIQSNTVIKAYALRHLHFIAYLGSHLEFKM